MKTEKKRNKVIAAVIAAIILYALISSGYVAIPCPTYRIFKFYCPGCGITRMVLSALKLDFYQAFRYNPFVFILSPLLIAYGVFEFIANVRKSENKINGKIPPWISVTVIVLLVIYGILRNIPAFSFLAPTIV